MVERLQPALLNSSRAREKAFLETLSEMGSLLEVQVFDQMTIFASSYLQPHYAYVGLNIFLMRRGRITLALKKIHRNMHDGIHGVYSRVRCENAAITSV